MIRRKAQLAGLVIRGWRLGVDVPDSRLWCEVDGLAMGAGRGAEIYYSAASDSLRVARNGDPNPLLMALAGGLRDATSGRPRAEARAEEYLRKAEAGLRHYALVRARQALKHCMNSHPAHAAVVEAKMKRLSARLSELERLAR